MKVSKIEKGTINDDFIHNWITLKVVDEIGMLYLMKLDIVNQGLYLFHYDTDTFETTLQEPTKELGQAVVEYMTNNDML